MFLALVLLSIAVALQPSLSYPLGVYDDAAQGFDISTNYDGYYGPWNYDYLRGNRWYGGYGPPYGFGPGYGRGLLPYDGYYDTWDMDYYAPYYGAPTRTVDVGREKLVRDFAVTETDNWIRDQTTYRVPPRYRYAPPYGPSPARRVFSGGMAGPRTSSIRTGGDFMYMRR